MAKVKLTYSAKETVPVGNAGDKHVIYLSFGPAEASVELDIDSDKEFETQFNNLAEKVESLLEARREAALAEINS